LIELILFMKFLNKYPKFHTDYSNCGNRKNELCIENIIDIISDGLEQNLKNLGNICELDVMIKNRINEMYNDVNRNKLDDELKKSIGHEFYLDDIHNFQKMKSETFNKIIIFPLSERYQKKISKIKNPFNDVDLRNNSKSANSLKKEALKIKNDLNKINFLMECYKKNANRENLINIVMKEYDNALEYVKNECNNEILEPSKNSEYLYGVTWANCDENYKLECKNLIKIHSWLKLKRKRFNMIDLKKESNERFIKSILNNRKLIKESISMTKKSKMKLVIKKLKKKEREIHCLTQTEKNKTTQNREQNKKQSGEKLNETNNKWHEEYSMLISKINEYYNEHYINITYDDDYKYSEKNYFTGKDDEMLMDKIVNKIKMTNKEVDMGDLKYHNSRGKTFACMMDFKLMNDKEFMEKNKEIFKNKNMDANILKGKCKKYVLNKIEITKNNLYYLIFYFIKKCYINELKEQVKDRSTNDENLSEVELGNLMEDILNNKNKNNRFYNKEKLLKYKEHVKIDEINSLILNQNHSLILEYLKKRDKFCYYRLNKLMAVYGKIKKIGDEINSLNVKKDNEYEKIITLFETFYNIPKEDSDYKYLMYENLFGKHIGDLYNYE